MPQSLEIYAGYPSHPPLGANGTMTPQQSTSKTDKQAKTAESDASSMMTTSSTSSTAQLLKNKFSLKKKKNKSSLKTVDERSPGEKQAASKEGRLNTETLATLGALR